MFSGKYSSNNHPDESTNNINGNVPSSTVDTNKKLDEISPLLHQQASISATNSHEPVDEASNANAANGNNRAGGGGAHKTNYRKRVKTKLSRKTA